jgi:hypothetical protein
VAQALNAWEARIREILGNPDTQILPAPDLTNALKGAFRRFGKDVPRRLHSDFTGDGVTFDLTKPAAWIDGFSTVWQIEYPQGERPPVFLDFKEIQPYPDTSAPTVIRLNETTPAAGKVARLYFTVPWPVPTADPAIDLVPDPDFEAVCQLAAHIAAKELAGRAAGHQRPNLPSATAIGSESEEDRWMRISKTCLAYYQDHVGTSSGPPGASATTDWDVMSTWQATGKRFLFRGRR